MNLASLGYFSNPQRSLDPIDWSEGGNIMRLEGDDWLTLLMVDSDIKSLQDLVK